MLKNGTKVYIPSLNVRGVIDGYNTKRKQYIIKTKYDTFLLPRKHFDIWDLIPWVARLIIKIFSKK